ncbi:MAG: biotin/lipoyl-containing protein, partial [Bacteroidota bacterium]|nr:biotin/lipoyl-containing protein [Bacteroidota bacterium]
MPKLGESVQEATITKWFVKEGDKIEEDEALFEVATDKVDSEIPSPVDGIIKKIFFEVNALVPVGETVIIITTEDDDETEPASEIKAVSPEVEKQPVVQELKAEKEAVQINTPTDVIETKESAEVKETKSTRFYSPLVLSIANSEQVNLSELETIKGSGLN